MKHRHQDGKTNKKKKQTKFLIKQCWFPRNKVSALWECGGCHPEGLIVDRFYHVCYKLEHVTNMMIIMIIIQLLIIIINVVVIKISICITFTFQCHFFSFVKQDFVSSRPPFEKMPYKLWENSKHQKWKRYLCVFKNENHATTRALMPDDYKSPSSGGNRVCFVWWLCW